MGDADWVKAIPEYFQGRYPAGGHFDKRMDKTSEVLFRTVSAAVPVEDFGNLVLVHELADLPDPVAGVITLEANVAYLQVVNELDLVGNRIQLPAGSCSYQGTSSETALMKSTGLGATPMITGTHTFVLQNISFTAEHLFDFDGATGGANVALDWLAVNFVDTPAIGTLKNFNNFIMTSGAFLNSSGMIFDGTCDTVAFSSMLFEIDAGGIGILIPATATVSRRFRIIYSAFVVLAGEEGIDVEVGAISNNETFILDTVSFGGGGDYVVGIDRTSIKALFTSTIGVLNSATVCNYYMVGNLTATANNLVAIGVPVKAAGATLDGPEVSKFTQTADNRATYTGNLEEAFQVSVTAALTAGNNQELSLYVAKNGVPLVSSQMTATGNAGGRVESISTLAIFRLSPGDYLEIFVANDTAAQDITVTNLQVIAKRIS